MSRDAEAINCKKEEGKGAKDLANRKSDDEVDDDSEE